MNDLMTALLVVGIVVAWYAIGFLFSVFWIHREEFQNAIRDDEQTTELVLKSLVFSVFGACWFVLWLIVKAMKPLNRWIWKRIGGKRND